MNDDHDSAASTDSVLIECDLPEPPEKVWRALTEPELVAEWLAPEEGAPPVDREIIEALPNERVRYRWRDGEAGGANAERPPLDSIVTFELSPTPEGGTHLRLVHTAFSITSQQTMAALAQPVFIIQSASKPPIAAAIAYLTLCKAA